MNKCQSEAVPVPLAPYPTPLILGGTACAAAAAGVLGLLTFLGNIVEDKVQKATAPLGVQLVEMEKRMWMRFDGVDQRFKGLENQFNGLEDRLKGVENRFIGLENRFMAVEEAVAQTNQRLGSIDSRLSRAETKLDHIGQSLRK